MKKYAKIWPPHVNQNEVSPLYLHEMLWVLRFALYSFLGLLIIYIIS